MNFVSIVKVTANIIKLNRYIYGKLPPEFVCSQTMHALQFVNEASTENLTSKGV